MSDLENDLLKSSNQEEIIENKVEPNKFNLSPTIKILFAAIKPLTYIISIPVIWILVKPISYIGKKLSSAYYSLLTKFIYPHHLSNRDSSLDENNIIKETAKKAKYGLITTDNPNPEGTIFLFHGNASSIRNEALYAEDNYPNYNIVIMEYPGYSSSPGKPNKKHIEESILEVYDHVTNHNNLKKPFIAIGESIGGYYAAYLAQKKELNGLALLSTYSILENAIYNFRFNRSIFGQENLDTTLILQQLNIPVVISHGEKDEIFDYTNNAKKNFASLKPGKGYLFSVKNSGHNTKLHNYTEILNKINPQNLDSKQPNTPITYVLPHTGANGVNDKTRKGRAF